MPILFMAAGVGMGGGGEQETVYRGRYLRMGRSGMQGVRSLSRRSAYLKP